MRQEDECLIGPLPQGDFLFPAIILPDDEPANIPSGKVIHYAATRHMEIAVYLTFALVREDVEAARGVPACREQGLIVGTLFVIELVQRLERTPVNQKGYKARLV
jgi:hypothetical protein